MHVDGSAVTEFNEKPTLATGWVSGGFFAFNRLMIDKYLDDDADAAAGEARRCRHLAADGQLGVFQHEGFWMGMDTFRDWTELNGLWDAGNPPWKVWDRTDPRRLRSARTTTHEEKATMKVLVTGTDGYLGCLLAPELIRDGHEVVGVDTGFYKARLALQRRRHRRR